MYNVLTMTAAFQVILEPEEDDNRPRLKNFQYRSTDTDCSDDKRSMAMVAVFVISFTPTAQTIQRQNLGSSERLKKAVS